VEALSGRIGRPTALPWLLTDAALEDHAVEEPRSIEASLARHDGNEEFPIVISVQPNCFTQSEPLMQEKYTILVCRHSLDRREVEGFLCVLGALGGSTATFEFSYPGDEAGSV
jgi:hypothetical protein